MTIMRLYTGGTGTESMCGGTGNLYMYYSTLIPVDLLIWVEFGHSVFSPWGKTTAKTLLVSLPALTAGCSAWPVILHC
jgi:hypothetical protein